MDIRSHLGASLSAAFACSFGLVAACASTELPSSSFGEVGDEGRPPPSPLPEGTGACAPEGPFLTEAEVLPSDLAVPDGGDASTWGTCEAACSIATSRRGGASVTRIDTCELTRLEAGDAGDGDAESGDAGDGGGADAGAFAWVVCRGAALPMCLGRRPLGHVEPARRIDEGLGGWLAAAAHLEVASVGAFAELVAQLRRWGAPEALVERCREARRDEVRHARVLGRLARRHGARTPRAERTTAADGILDVALHNAREGCAGETWAAVLAVWQGAHAADSELRAAFASIAEDEIRHAQLAWDLHAWFMTRLDPAERRAVRRELRAALRKVAEGAGAEARTAPAALGLPPPDVLAHVGSDLALRLRAAA